MAIPFLLAPMAELSHRALRELIAGFGGCDGYFTEMINAGSLIAGGPFESWYVDAGPCPGRVVYQITGFDQKQIAAAATLLDSSECAGIDINMGCSAPAIVRTGAGVRWMASIDRAGELVRLVRRGVRRRLSVKLRLGMAAASVNGSPNTPFSPADFDYLVRFCRRLEGEGVEFITLHPRTANEKFKRSAQWDYVGRLRQELGIPVAGNGDIANAADLLRRAHLANGGYDAVMTGRAAVREPWLFAQARAVEADGAIGPVNLEETGLRFLDLLAAYQPPAFHLSRARRFFAYYGDNVIWAHYLKTLLNRETTLSGMAGVFSAYFREHPEERIAAK